MLLFGGIGTCSRSPTALENPFGQFGFSAFACICRQDVLCKIITFEMYGAMQFFDLAKASLARAPAEKSNSMATIEVRRAALMNCSVVENDCSMTAVP